MSVKDQIKEYGKPEWFAKIHHQLVNGVDPAVAAVSFDDSKLINDIIHDKYSYKDDKNWNDICHRVTNGIHRDENEHAELTYLAMRARLWMPGGRILAGAGTEKRVTLMNCYVNATVPDNMEGIADCLKNIMLTMQQGGGIGTDFSTIRPSRALLKRTGSWASGPLPFMDTWHAACGTIMSAGDRRGAMMGTITDTHPDMPAFVVAKKQEGRLTNFNISVLVSDAFMAAVEDDEDWDLYFHEEPYSLDRPTHLVERDFYDENNVKQYVYSTWKARDLWELITRNTYEYSEPGVIFIDRVNDLNNLQYCERISCTNPCGEQPLPPHGTCNLGAVNLARMVNRPFSDDAEFNWELLKAAVQVGVRFLDNVIEQTNYPLPEQEAEERSKRRIGLGISGLGDCLHQLGIRYGSGRSVELTKKVMQVIAETAYTTSVALAKERGAFPLFDKYQFFEGFAGERFSNEMRSAIMEHGIRNGVLLTIAPTGTTSIAYGNISSGLEPTFLHVTRRRVLQGDGTHQYYDEYGFAARLWLHLNPDKTIDDLPKHMVTAEDLKVYDHIRIQEACQYWVDASVSKTINCPENITYEEFVEVYRHAYEAGCKGCTTYRPSDVRGSVLSKPTDEPGKEVEAPKVQVINAERPETLNGQTIKLNWPSLKSAIYLTINELENGEPYEIFLSSKDQRHMEWMTTVTLLMSWVLRRGCTLQELASELKQIHSAGEGGWADKLYHPSLVSYLGFKLEQYVHRKQTAFYNHVIQAQSLVNLDFAEVEQKVILAKGKQCDNCGSYAIKMESGCGTCTNCGNSKCG